LNRPFADDRVLDRWWTKQRPGYQRDKVTSTAHSGTTLARLIEDDTGAVLARLVDI